MTAQSISMSDRDRRRLLALGAPVGIEGRNRREDVARLELLLGLAGAHDLDATDGPTGFFGQRLDQSIRRFQNRNGLKVDGVVRPRSETISRLAQMLPDEPESSASPNESLVPPEFPWPPRLPPEPPDERIPEPSVWDRIGHWLNSRSRERENEWWKKVPPGGGVAPRHRG